MFDSRLIPSSLSSILLLLVCLPGIALAQSFDAPESVVAEASGNFIVNTVFTFGEGGGEFAAATVLGLVNVDLAMVADGFCLQHYEEGESLDFGFTASLVDPTLPGSVQVEISDCQGHSFSAEIAAVPTILEYSMDVPESVNADVAGHFSYPAIFTFGTGGGEFAFAEVLGLENVNEALIADGFCMHFFEGGHETEILVEADLVDPFLPGRVQVTMADCQGHVFTAETLILPHTVANEAESWGTIKAHYR